MKSEQFDYDSIINEVNEAISLSEDSNIELKSDFISALTTAHTNMAETVPTELTLLPRHQILQNDDLQVLARELKTQKENLVDIVHRSKSILAKSLVLISVVGTSALILNQTLIDSENDLVQSSPKPQLDMNLKNGVSQSEPNGGVGHNQICEEINPTNMNMLEPLAVKKESKMKLAAAKRTKAKRNSGVRELKKAHHLTSSATVPTFQERDGKERDGTLQQEVKMFEDARNAYKKGDYYNSLQRFKKYTKRFPNGRFNRDSQAYIVRSYCAQSIWEDCIEHGLQYQATFGVNHPDINKLVNFAKKEKKRSFLHQMHHSKSTSK